MTFHFITRYPLPFLLLISKRLIIYSRLSSFQLLQEFFILSNDRNQKQNQTISLNEMNRKDDGKKFVSFSRNINLTRKGPFFSRYTTHSHSGLHFSAVCVPILILWDIFYPFQLQYMTMRGKEILKSKKICLGCVLFVTYYI